MPAVSCVPRRDRCILCFFANPQFAAVFPGLMESIDDRDWENALKWVDIVESCIRKAAKSI